jgi:serine/threonine-protein kinase
MLDPETLAAAKRQLTSIVGPIAGILVDKAAARAASTKDLYSLLMQHLDSEADRARFAALTSARLDPSSAAAAKPIEEPPASARATSIAQADVDRLAAILASYLGPIAPIVSRRESRTSASLDELQQRLAALIPSERERADFLNRLQAH